MTAVWSPKRAAARAVVWQTRADDHTAAPDARQLLELLGLVQPGEHHIAPEDTRPTRLVDEQGRIVSATTPGRPPAPGRKRGHGPGRKPIPIEHGTDHGYRQHKAKKTPIPGDDACGCQAAHNALLTQPRTRPRAGTPTATPPPRKPVIALGGSSLGSTTSRRTVAEAVPTLVIASTPPSPPERVQQPAGPQPLPPVPTDLDAWLTAAQQSPRAAVRRDANTAAAALMWLRWALDDLARAERSTP